MVNYIPFLTLISSSCQINQNSFNKGLPTVSFSIPNTSLTGVEAIVWRCKSLHCIKQDMNVFDLVVFTFCENVLIVQMNYSELLKLPVFSWDLFDMDPSPSSILAASI